jgi:hypothetical protein
MTQSPWSNRWMEVKRYMEDPGRRNSIHIGTNHGYQSDHEDLETLSVGEAWLSLFSNLHPHERPYDQASWFNGNRAMENFAVNERGKTSQLFRGSISSGRTNYISLRQGIHIGYIMINRTPALPGQVKSIHHRSKGSSRTEGCNEYPTQLDVDWHIKRRCWATRQDDVV